jgi:hypothetical protein
MTNLVDEVFRSHAKQEKKNTFLLFDGGLLLLSTFFRAIL